MAVVKQDGDWWIGWIEEIPGVNCLGAAGEELLESVKITLRKALEFDRQDAVSLAGMDYEEELVTVWSEKNWFVIYIAPLRTFARTKAIRDDINQSKTNALPRRLITK